MSWDSSALNNGLGITSLYHLSSAFAGKTLLCFRTKDNLWPCFMRSKYEDPIHLFSTSTSSRFSDSHTCKRMLSVLDDIEPHIGLCTRSGTSSFWCEDWTFVGKLADHALDTSLQVHSTFRIKHLFYQDSWKSDLLTTILLSTYSDFILPSSHYFSAGTDEYIWMLEPSGKFSI